MRPTTDRFTSPTSPPSTRATACGGRRHGRSWSRSRQRIFRTKRSVHARAGARGRLGPVSRAARDVRRRARLGALLPVRVRASALGRAVGGGERARARRRRVQGDRLAPPREGYRVWGADITPEDTPFEVALGFAESSSTSRTSSGATRSRPRTSRNASCVASPSPILARWRSARSPFACGAISSGA